jgi:PepSY-associated TM region
LRTFSLSATAWRWLVVGHRWLGVATCLLFAMWFVTGLVMMYVRFPEYTQAERFSHLEPLDAGQVRIAPERVLHGRALGEFPRDFRLEMMAGEPVYRVTAAGWPFQTVSAATGRLIERVDIEQARAIVARASGAQASSATTLQRDQWTVAGTFEGHRPLHRISVAGDEGLELYVSSRTGEIVLDTTARERRWNWVGAVLHWIYFTDLRAHPALWSQVVMWTSGVCIVVAVTGLWLGVDRLRFRRRNGNRSITPFRGWMAWHHVAGIVGGVFVLTWIFSGWLSMGPPVPWERAFEAGKRTAAAAALAGNSEPEFPVDLALLQRLAGGVVRQVTFEWSMGGANMVLRESPKRASVIDARTGAPRLYDVDRIVAQAPRMLPDAQLIAVERVDSEDAYWYSRDASRTLPVLRLKFDDADGTWIHVDLETGRLVGWLRRSDRINRWLFNGLHSFDLRWLLLHRPAWDALMWILTLAGLTISTTSIVIGWRALRR